MAIVGVSIAIPDPYGTQLREARASFGDPLAATVPSHITLVPPTQMHDDQIGAFAGRLTAAAEGVRAYTLRLRGTGTFRPVSPVVFVAVSRGISNTELLAARIRRELGDTIPEAEFPFHPHVTVAHGLSDEALDVADESLKAFECEFVVDAFELYLHREPQGWIPEQRFELVPS